MPYKDIIARRAYHKAYQRAHPEDWKDDRLRRQYGITLKDFYILVDKQNGRCGICRQVYNTKLHIDHDHKTNKIRGLLCLSCNVQLGVYEKLLANKE